MQADWVTGVLTPGPLWPVGVRMYDTGRVLTLGPGGEITREHAAAVQVEGSYSDKLRVWSPDGASLWLSGNPCKFFQGHNLFGSGDHAGLWLAAGIEVRQRLGLFPGPSTAEGFDPPRWTRLDLTRSYRFDSDIEARAWLRDVAATARSRHGSPLHRQGSVTWGAGSTRWSAKAYLKSDELDKHKLNSDLPERARRELREWASGVVRFEVTLRSKELQKLGLERAADCDSRALWERYFGSMTWNRNVEVMEACDMVDESVLPANLAGVLAWWRAGVDVRSRVSRATFYKHRKALLQAVGVDIASAPPPRAPAPAPRVSVALDPARWDPEPLKAYLFEPDPSGELKRSYRLL